MKVIVKAVAGSHLFGLNTEKSDKDFKGVFIPTGKQILTGNYPKTIQDKTNPGNTKNTKEDIDIELYSLKKFLSMLEEGQTVALELLFTPEHLIIEKTPEWDFIVSKRDKLVHKGVSAFIGYARTQANRYGIRGSRMGTLEKAMDIIRELPNKKLYELTEELKPILDLEFVELLMSQDYLNNVYANSYYKILGRQYQLNMSLANMRNSLEVIYKEYGARSLQAKNNEGIDFKAVSHALRVMDQGVELLRTGKLTLPLRKYTADFILKVKKGELDFTTEVQPVLEMWMEHLVNAEQTSLLPEKIDTENILLELHLNQLFENRVVK